MLSLHPAHGRARSHVLARTLVAAALLCAGLAVSNVAVAYSLGPVVKKLAPKTGSAAGATQVRIYGVNLSEAISVRFGSTAATSYTVSSATLIKATSPNGSGTVDVTVTTPGGTSATAAVDHFTFLPAVTAVSPDSGPVDGGSNVTIAGFDFAEATAVRFGSIPATSFTVNSATSITAATPPEAVGRVHVTVSTPDGTSQTSPRDTFGFTPTVTGVSPARGLSAGGARVSLTGSGFITGTSGTRINFGGASATAVNCTTTTECSATAPRPPSAVLKEVLQGQEVPVDVRVRVGAAASPKTAADQFTYHELPGLYLTSANTGARLPAGTSVQLRDVVFGAQSECFPHVVGSIAANSGEPEIVAGYVAQYGSCEPRPSDWYGLLSGFRLRVDPEGNATIAGGIGVLNPYGCEYEGSGMSGSLGGGYLSVRLNSTLSLSPSPERQLWESEVEEARWEIERLEMIAEPTPVDEEELAEWKAFKSQLETKLAETEQECSPTATMSLVVEDEAVHVVRVP